MFKQYFDIDKPPAKYPSPSEHFLNKLLSLSHGIAWPGKGFYFCCGRYTLII